MRNKLVDGDLMSHLICLADAHNFDGDELSRLCVEGLDNTHATAVFLFSKGSDIGKSVVEGSQKIVIDS